jgi:hypothetical protein
LPEVAYNYVSRSRVELAANPAATKPNSRLSSAGSKRLKSTRPNRTSYFFNSIDPKRHFAATQQTVADEPTADIALPSESRIYQLGVGTTPSFFCRLDDDVVY